MSPDIVKTLAREAGYDIVRYNYHTSGAPATGNLYYDRDIVLLLRPTE